MIGRVQKNTSKRFSLGNASIQYYNNARFFFSTYGSQLAANVTVHGTVSMLHALNSNDTNDDVAWIQKKYIEVLTI